MILHESSVDLSSIPAHSPVDVENYEDCFPRFTSVVRGPVFPQRKKLVAAKAMILVPTSPAVAVHW